MPQLKLTDKLVDVTVFTIDRVVNTPDVQPTASNVPLVAQRQVPTIEKILKTVEIIQAQLRFEDKLTDSPVAAHDRCCDSAVQNTVKPTEIQYIERIINDTVVIQHQAPTIQTGRWWRFVRVTDVIEW